MDTKAWHQNSPPDTYSELQIRLAQAHEEAEVWSAFFGALQQAFPGLIGATVRGQDGTTPTLALGTPPSLSQGEAKHLLGEWVLTLYGQGWPADGRALTPTLAEPLLAALERCRLRQEVERLRQDLELLTVISQDLALDNDSDTLYTKAFNALVTRYPDLVGFGSQFEPGGKLRIRWAFGPIPPDLVSFDLYGASQGTAGSLIATHQRQAVYGAILGDFERTRYDGEEEEFILPPNHQRLAAAIKARSLAFIPILAWEGIAGVVVLLTPREDFFQPQVRRVIEGVLLALSRSVERAVQFEDEHRLSEGLSLLSQIGIGSDWQEFLSWIQRMLSAAGTWLLWENRSLGADFWSLVASRGLTPDLPDILPVDGAEEMIRASLSKMGLVGEVLTLERDGAVRGAWGWCHPGTGSPVAIPPWIHIIRDHLGLAQEDLEHHLSLQTAAHRDPLTGLYNRTYLEKYLENRRKNAGEMAFAILDLDHFKDLNDTHGHDFGDEVLRLIGARLWESLRDGDLAIRLGGDEFVLLLEGCPEDRVATVLARIVQSLPLTEYDLGVSGGVAYLPRQGRLYQELYRLADQALYRVKRSGRNGLTLAGATRVRTWHELLRTERTGAASEAAIAEGDQ